MAKKKTNKFLTTDQLLYLAGKCESGQCNSRCPYFGKQECKNIMLKKLRNRLYSYYSVVGELEGNQ